VKWEPLHTVGGTGIMENSMGISLKTRNGMAI
jgi:hypothetical protein